MANKDKNKTGDSSKDVVDPKKKSEELFKAQLGETPTTSQNKMADSAHADAHVVGTQPSDSMKDMAEAMKCMSKTLNSFISSQNAHHHNYADVYDDEALLYDGEDGEGEDYDSNFSETELLGFANDGTAVTRKRPSSGSVDHPNLPSKKLKVLEKMKLESSIEEAKGPSINEMLSDNVTNFMRNKAEDAKFNTTLDKYPPPENCLGLETIRVNPQVWRRISHEAKGLDLKLQRAHTALIRGTNAFVQLANVLLEDWDAETGALPEESFQKMMTYATDALKILGGANYELCMRRREFIRDDVTPDFRLLCSAAGPYTTLLFGDDVVKTIKDMSEVNKLSNAAFKPQKSGIQGRNQGRGRGRGRGRGEGKGGPYKKSGRGRGYQTPRQPRPAQGEFQPTGQNPKP